MRLPTLFPRLIGTLALLAIWFTNSSPTLHAAAAKPLDIYLPESPPPPPPREIRNGKVEDKYPDGALHVERRVLVLSDDQQVNHGPFTEYYKNGQKFAEGNYERGVYDGKWSFWHENGQLCKEVVFKKGVPDGSWEVFRADGSLQATKNYKLGKRDGKWTEYLNDGKTEKLIQSYADGSMTGDRLVYFPNGKLRQKATLKVGKLDGVVEEWDESGRKRAEFNLVEGKLDGLFHRWDTSGNETILEFKMGQRVFGSRQGGASADPASTDTQATDAASEAP